jgi:16S rRNA (cytosine1402-N4)-methyltransferase
LTSTTGRRNDTYHRPVLAEETVSYLVTRPDGIYFDLTLGAGGHLKSLSRALSAEALLVGVDRDPEAISAARENLKSIPQKFEIINSRFAALETVMRKLEVGKVDGFILDLGVSSHQIDVSRRGFGYMQDGPLDMRMGPDTDLTAETIVNEYSERDLTFLFKKYGEEKRARAIAGAIGRSRNIARIMTTDQLRGVVESAGDRRDIIGTLSRIFQALRIEVNGELEELEQVLPVAAEALNPGGRMVVISYHSLEDRIVKRFFAAEEKGCICPPAFPICACGKKPSLKILTKKIVRPTEDEIKTNSRAKSARLRAAEKIG